MRVVLLAVLLTLFGGFFSAQAHQSLCGPDKPMTQALWDRFGEKEVASGVTTGGWRFALFTRDGGATWTVVAFRGDDTACVIADGVDWEHVERPFPVERQLDIEPSLP